MAFFNWLDIEMKGTIYGVPTVYKQRAFTEILQPNPQAIDVYTEVRAQWWDALKPLVSEAFTMLSIQVIAGTIDSPTYTTYEGYVNEQGLVSTSDSAVSWLAVNLTRYPDNTKLFATYADPGDFRNGRVGIAGVPEIDIEGNFLTDDALPIWEDVAQSWKVLTTAYGGSTPNAYTGMQRWVYAGDPPAFVGVAYTIVEDMHVSQKLGSRVGRKP